MKCRRPLYFPASFSTVLCPRSWLVLPCQIQNLLMKIIFSLIWSCGIYICLFAVTLPIWNVIDAGSSSENSEEKRVIFIDHVGKPIWEELFFDDSSWLEKQGFLFNHVLSNFKVLCINFNTEKDRISFSEVISYLKNFSSSHQILYLDCSEILFEYGDLI